VKKTKVLYGLLIAIAGLFSFTSGASALTYPLACTNGNYAATNMLDYSLSGTAWFINYITYTYTPYQSASTHNNLNERMFNLSGTLIYAYNSMDNLLRDGNLHAAHYFTTPLQFAVGQKLQLTNIFDVPNAADPQCTTTFQR
jgi:hypothetical protein